MERWMQKMENSKCTHRKTHHIGGSYIQSVAVFCSCPAVVDGARPNAYGIGKPNSVKIESGLVCVDCQHKKRNDDDET